MLAGCAVLTRAVKAGVEVLTVGSLVASSALAAVAEAASRTACCTGATVLARAVKACVDYNNVSQVFAFIIKYQKDDLRYSQVWQ